MSSLALLTALVVGAWIAPAGELRADIVVDFENNPNLPAQPNNFFAAGPMQTYTQTGVYSITGGVVLGNPTFLAAFAAHGSAPNLYGTTDIADPSLQSTISLTMPAAENVTTVSGVFFNGQPGTESYILTAKSGSTTVGTATPTMTGSSSTSDFFNFSFTSTSALPITSVTFTTPNSTANGWDFFVDTIHIVPTATSIPEPSVSVLAGLALLAGAGCRWVRNRNRTG